MIEYVNYDQQIISSVWDTQDKKDKVYRVKSKQQNQRTRFTTLDNFSSHKILKAGKIKFTVESKVKLIKSQIKFSIVTNKVCKIV